MDKHLAYYTLWDSVDWPERLVRQYKQSGPTRSLIYLEAGSEEDLQFQDEVRGLGLNVTRGLLWQSSGEDLYRHPFHFLTTHTVSSYRAEESLDLTAACGGQHPKLLPCRIGARQVKKIAVKTAAHSRSDVILLLWRYERKVYLFSKRIVRALRQLQLTGHEFVPCLSQGSQYSDLERSFESKVPRLEEEAEFYQLVVPTQAPGVPTVGKLVDVTSRCPRCGTYYGYLPEHRPYFQASDLAPVDFQVYRRARADGVGLFYPSSEVLVISARVLRALRENEARGLRQYLPDPPIEFGVVEISS
jgi:hypothetical protein